MIANSFSRICSEGALRRFRTNTGEGICDHGDKQVDKPKVEDD